MKLKSFCEKLDVAANALCPLVEVLALNKMVLEQAPSLDGSIHALVFPAKGTTDSLI